jgi:hypothetical protein
LEAEPRVAICQISSLNSLCGAESGQGQHGALQEHATRGCGCGAAAGRRGAYPDWWSLPATFSSFRAEVAMVCIRITVRRSKEYAWPAVRWDSRVERLQVSSLTLALSVLAVLENIKPST